jgi:hypothetical protein
LSKRRGGDIWWLVDAYDLMFGWTARIGEVTFVDLGWAALLAG